MSPKKHNGTQRIIKIRSHRFAREHFLREEGDLDSAMLRLPAAGKKSLAGDLDAVVEAMKRVPWTALEEMKGDAELFKKIDDAQALLKSLRITLSS